MARLRHGRHHRSENTSAKRADVADTGAASWHRVTWHLRLLSSSRSARRVYRPAPMPAHGLPRHAYQAARRVAKSNNRRRADITSSKSRRALAFAPLIFDQESSVGTVSRRALGESGVMSGSLATYEIHQCLIIIVVSAISSSRVK